MINIPLSLLAIVFTSQDWLCVFSVNTSVFGHDGFS